MVVTQLKDVINVLSSAKIALARILNCNTSWKDIELQHIMSEMQNKQSIISNFRSGISKNSIFNMILIFRLIVMSWKGICLIFPVCWTFRTHENWTWTCTDSDLRTAMYWPPIEMDTVVFNCHSSIANNDKHQNKSRPRDFVMWLFMWISCLVESMPIVRNYALCKYLLLPFCKMAP